VLDLPHTAAAARGSSIQNVEPFPAALLKEILPPCASTIARANANPRPVPAMPLAAASPRKNLVKMRSC
jgi:hypothetical protein